MHFARLVGRWLVPLRWVRSPVCLSVSNRCRWLTITRFPTAQLHRLDRSRLLRVRVKGTKLLQIRFL